MAPVTSSRRLSVRAAHPGEGPSVAALWRELWEAHEDWGGYPGSRDTRVYAQLAQRLDEDARVRGGHPVLGRHVHLIADVGGAACGQVEGWFERHGIEGDTPFTCEVRSLVVTERARGLGAGRALLDALASAARMLAQGAPCLLAAEVLERNPARAFYSRIGFLPVAYTARIGARLGAGGGRGRFGARLAAPGDAPAIARLEAMLAARRHAGGDVRFDAPRVLDPSLVGGIAATLAAQTTSSLREPATLVAYDGASTVRAAASVTAHTLEPPFLPLRRALVGRFALDSAWPAAPLVGPLVALGCKLALARGATHVELTDLSPPGSDLYEAALSCGAHGWSRVVTRLV
jgi:GNAT superfamily N-acetyltransferase